MFPADFGNRRGLDAAIELGRFREDLNNAVHQSGRYLAMLPECLLKAEHAVLHAELEALQARFKVTIENGKQALYPFISGKTPQA
jgi:hypothetical protein